MKLIGQPLGGDPADYIQGAFMSEMFNPPHPGEILKDTVCREARKKRRPKIERLAA